MNRIAATRRCKRAGLTVMALALSAWAVTCFVKFRGNWEPLSLRIGTGTVGLYWGGEQPGSSGADSRGTWLWTDAVWPRPEAERYGFFSGFLAVQWTWVAASWRPIPLHADPEWLSDAPPASIDFWRWGIVAPALDFPQSAGDFFTLGFPMWTLLVPGFGLLFCGHALALGGASGRCRRCTYDLTGITGPCPECGAET